MSINITKTENGFAIYFPFELKDVFKEHFKSAKWNSAARRWEVGSRSGKKLEQWRDTFEQAAAEIEEKESAGFNENELAKLQEQAARIRTEIHKARTEKAAANETIQALEAAKQELEEAKKELAAVKEEAKEANIQAKKILSELIDITAISQAHTSMINNRRNRASEREKWNEAQQTLEQAARTLQNAGFFSHGISKLIMMTYNRPDRDCPRSVTLSEILNISRI